MIPTTENSIVWQSHHKQSQKTNDKQRKEICNLHHREASESKKKLNTMNRKIGKTHDMIHQEIHVAPHILNSQTQT